MPEIDSPDGTLAKIELDSVEREATPQLLVKLSIHLHVAGLSLSNTVSILKCSVSNGLARLFITGFTRPIYSPTTGEIRITLRSMKP